MKKRYILTIVSIGLFIGFWLGYYVFAQVHVKVVCRPSGRVLLDTRRNLMQEITLNVNVTSCESIDFVIEKANVQDVIFGGETKKAQEKSPTSQPGTEAQEQPSSQPSIELPESEGQFPEAQVPIPPRVEETTLVLEIFDICSADINIGDYPEVSYCLGIKPPYYVILQKGESYIKTSFFGDIGFTKTYSLSASTPISQVFVHDLYTLSENVKGIEIYGSNSSYFSIGLYTERDVLEPETERLAVQKMLKEVRALIFPLYASDNVQPSPEWSKLSFYLRTEQNLYHIGDIWFYFV